jgi:hypothetical protein
MRVSANSQWAGWRAERRGAATRPGPASRLWAIRTNRTCPHEDGARLARARGRPVADHEPRSCARSLSCPQAGGDRLHVSLRLAACGRRRLEDAEDRVAAGGLGPDVDRIADPSLRLGG